MKFLEKTIEDIIFNTSRPQLKERGLDVKGYLKRQVRLGPYGILDLISIYPCRDTYHNTGKLHFIITVYELKLKDVSERTFWQCCQYTKIIQLGIENTYCLPPTGFLFAKDYEEPKITELTLQDIADKFNLDVSSIRIKD